MSHESTPTEFGAAAPVPRGANFRILVGKLESALARIARTENVSQLLEAALQSLLDQFEDELGFEGGRLYRRERDEFCLIRGVGKSRDVPLGTRVPHDYPPHQRTLADGLVVMSRGETGFNAEFESTIGVSSTFAAVAVGEENSHIIAFSIKGRVREEQIYLSLTAVRHVINLKLQQQKVTGMLEEARRIQESMLPAAPPVLDGFDIEGRSRPAELVGGDLFDYLPVSGELLGLAIVDSSGHGLPAALLARDVVTGLRMRVGETSRIVPTLERLNRVIHRAALSSKFVSLFYAELRRDGTLVYCNAGHNPPLLKRGRSFVELDRGGTVLGPLPAGRYESAALCLEPGDVIVMYTDGVVERESREGEQYGTDRLRRLLLETEGASAGGIVRAILADVDRHGCGVAPSDDMTILAVRRI